MVDGVASVSFGSGVGATSAAKDATHQEQVLAESLSAAIKGISPRMSTDPVSGVLITEYLSTDGQIEMQLPSEVAVAYLRSGLTETGQPVHDQAPRTDEREILA